MDALEGRQAAGRQDPHPWPDLTSNERGRAPRTRCLAHQEFCVRGWQGECDRRDRLWLLSVLGLDSCPSLRPVGETKGPGGRRGTGERRALVTYSGHLTRRS